MNFFTDADLYDPEGRNVMLLGLDVLPEYRGRDLPGCWWTLIWEESGIKDDAWLCLPVWMPK